MKKELLIGAVGIVVGILLTFGFAMWISATEDESEYLLRKKKITAGDIQVRFQKPDKTFEEQNIWEIWLLKNDVPFVLITQNKNKETTGFYMAHNLNDKNYPVVELEPSDSPGKWKDLAVTSIGYDLHTGTMLKDYDFNGEFDFELIVDGNNTTRFIHYESHWIHVNKYDSNQITAVAGGSTFVFQEGAGWVKQ